MCPRAQVVVPARVAPFHAVRELPSHLNDLLLHGIA
jgi:hypothetical protein